MPRVMALERGLLPPEDAWTPEMFASEFAQPGLAAALPGGRRGTR